MNVQLTEQIIKRLSGSNWENLRPALMQ